MLFCVEDDQAIRNLMIYTLNNSGFEALGIEDGEALFSALKKKLPELILLDIMLPGEDGVTILKKLRENPATADIPIIMASAKGTEYDKVIGLDLGADDYLAKELTLKEYEMLRLFMENPGRVFTRDQLFCWIWSSEHAVESRTVDVHIGTLRTKLGACAEYIKTVRGVGYRMEDRQ